ncbi:hypothetical protein TSUD_161950 [Trifolium subterraneum]|uniref:Uncharacterized protein n=1 Tax=Trifolium subterraneum TaxID=3900 RepID=A0A2Z6MDC5_TRISU|nr:hypothetical protein TSUD_161950 [Trifolium subterraneum]
MSETHRGCAMRDAIDGGCETVYRTRVVLCCANGAVGRNGKEAKWQTLTLLIKPCLTCVPFIFIFFFILKILCRISSTQPYPMPYQCHSAVSQKYLTILENRCFGLNSLGHVLYAVR